jgi:Tfp pilus assembly PilM family ATPase
VALINLGATFTSIHFMKDSISNFIRDVNWGGRELVQAITKARRCEYAEAEKLLLKAGTEGPVLDERLSEEKPIQEESQGPAAGSPLDPFAEELGRLDQREPLSEEPDAEAESGRDVTDSLAPPLARLVTEVRRSFDYYEQQLYERPVDRVILSGGAAQVPAVRDAFVSDLGIESVEVADPTTSALLMGASHAVAEMTSHPAQFMVAVGLASRGAAEL